MSATTSIDITDLVSKIQDGFVLWAVDLEFTALAASPYFYWVAYPILSNITKFLLTQQYQRIASAAAMLAFFQATAIRKASQAKDYVDVVNQKFNLPPTASEAEYEKAERAQIAAFNGFVVLGS